MGGRLLTGSVRARWLPPAACGARRWSGRLRAKRAGRCWGGWRGGRRRRRRKGVGRLGGCVFRCCCFCWWWCGGAGVLLGWRVGGQRGRIRLCHGGRRASVDCWCWGLCGWCARCLSSLLLLHCSCCSSSRLSSASRPGYGFQEGAPRASGGQGEGFGCQCVEWVWACGWLGWVFGLGVCVVLQVGFEFVMGACPLRPHPGQEGQAKEPKARHPGLEDNKGRCMHAATEGWVGSAPWTARGGKGLTQGLGTHVGGPMPSNDSSTSWRLATLALILLALSSTHHNAHRALPHPTHPHREAKAIAEARKGYGFLISSAHKERPPRHRHTIRSPTPPHPTHPHRDAKTMAEAEAEAEAEAVEDPLNFSMMTEAIARLWLEEHPEKVNDLDTDGNPLLWVAACGP